MSSIYGIENVAPEAPIGYYRSNRKFGDYPYGYITIGGWCMCSLEDGVSLQGLLPLLTQRPEYRRLSEQIRNAEGIPPLTGINEAAHPFVVAALATSLKRPIVFVVGDETQATQTVETLKQFVSTPEDVFCLPDRDALPYERLMSGAETIQQRMQALIALVTRNRTSVIVCSSRVLTQLVIPPQELAGSLVTLKPSQEVDLTVMLEQLYNLGYTPVADV